MPAPSSVATLGVFDGVHRGHRLVVSHAVERAAVRGLRSVGVTFDPHPLAVLAPDAAPLLLTTVARRVALLVEAGLDEVVVLDFTPELAALSPADFAAQVLGDQLAAELVVVGADWRFGHKAAGDVRLLSDLGHDVDPVDLLQAGGEAVSSSAVRAAVAVGDVGRAATMLTRPHLVEGPVVAGEKRGRTLGYPTANVAVDAGIAVPADGVYAGVLTRADGTPLPAAISIGTNPTFAGERSRQVEAYVMDHGHDLDLYDEAVTVSVTQRLRGMTAFDGVDALVTQMGHDVEHARSVLSAAGPLVAVAPLH